MVVKSSSIIHRVNEKKLNFEKINFYTSSFFFIWTQLIKISPAPAILPVPETFR